jgi:glycine/D-amino acid oxidase-like deaminating enzyme
VSGRGAEPLAGEHVAEVVVLGAGLAGIAVARELARRRVCVVVVEPGTIDAAAGADLGHVMVGLAEPYDAASARLGRDEARGVWEQLREGHERLGETLRGLADDCGHRRAGGFRLAVDRVGGMRLADSEDMLREDGFSGEFFDRWMLEARFDLRDLSGAYWGADDGELDARRLARGLVSDAERAGVVFHETSPLLDLDLSERGAEAVTARGRIRAGLAVVTGPATGLVPALEARLVERRVHHVRFELPIGAAVPAPALVMGAPVRWVSGSGDLVLETGGAEDEMTAAPHLPAGAVVGGEPWSGTILETRDGLPLVGRLAEPAALVSCGHEKLGAGSALLAARWLAEAVATGQDPTPGPFQARRPAL